MTNLLSSKQQKWNPGANSIKHLLETKQKMNRSKQINKEKAFPFIFFLLQRIFVKIFSFKAGNLVKHKRILQSLKQKKETLRIDFNANHFGWFVTIFQCWWWCCKMNLSDFGILELFVTTFHTNIFVMMIILIFGSFAESMKNKKQKKSLNQH